MSLIRHVAVVIPARDEAEWISSTLTAVNCARSRLSISSSCVVVVDGCADTTRAVVHHRSAGSRPEAPVLLVETTRNCVGAVRRLGSRLALAGALHPPGRVWLANTDADTLVPEDWLSAQVLLAERGATAVAGTVELGADADASLRERFDRTYRLESDGTHRHVHGANLGVRGDVYRAAGGWCALATGEDHDLWERIGQCSPHRLSSTSITVRTSARTTGRAPGGFAADLARLLDGADDHRGSTVA